MEAPPEHRGSPVKLRFQLTPVVLATFIFTSVAPAATKDVRPTSSSTTCALLAAQIVATTWACALGNVPACLALAIAIDKYNRDCEGGAPPEGPATGGPTMRPR